MDTLTDVGERLAAEQRRVVEVFRARGERDPRYGWFDAAYLLTMQDLERKVLGALRGLGLDHLERLRILEVGCGNGFWLRRFATWGADPAQVVGVELLDTRVREARRACARQTRILRGNGACLPIRDGQFDLVCQMLVFTSVLDDMTRRRMAGEMMRALAPGGTILWYDYHVSNPSNPNVRGVGRREIRTLFPGMDVRLQRVTLAPPLARVVAPRVSWLYHACAAVPLLRTHYLATIRHRPGGTGAGGGEEIGRR